jgi:hypothetical protein
MTKVGRAIEKAETQGFMKVVVDAEASSTPPEVACAFHRPMFTSALRWRKGLNLRGLETLPVAW